MAFLTPIEYSRPLKMGQKRRKLPKIGQNRVKMATPLLYREIEVLREKVLILANKITLYGLKRPLKCPRSLVNHPDG